MQGGRRVDGTQSAQRVSNFGDRFEKCSFERFSNLSPNTSIWKENEPVPKFEHARFPSPRTRANTSAERAGRAGFYEKCANCGLCFGTPW